MEQNQKIKEYFEKAQEAFNKNNLDYAIELLRAVLSASPGLAAARHLLWLSFKKKADQTPSSLLKKALTRAKNLPLSLRAGYLLSKGRNLEAADQYEKILEVCPSNTSALTNMAQAFLREKMNDCAIKILEVAVQIKPDHIPALKKLGQLYLECGDYQKARSSFESILKISPGEPQAQRELKNLDALGTIQKSFSKES
jgi:tetratricopeptide (TPR) repeat protein